MIIFIENIPAWAKLSIEKACALMLHPVWVPALLLLLLALFALRYVTKLYHKHNQGWLSTKAKIRLREIQRQPRVFWKLSKPPNVNGLLDLSFEKYGSLSQYLQTGLWTDLRSYYLPSVASLLLATLCIFIFSEPLKVSFIGGENSLDKNLETVFSVIGAVVIALIVFVAETLRSEEDSDRKRVLLKISNLWLLILIVTVIPVCFLLGASQPVIFLLAILVTLMTVLSFYRIISNMISPGAQEKSQIAFFKGRFRRLLERSTLERVGNNILAGDFGRDESEDVIKYTPFMMSQEREKYTFIRLPRNGRVTDINISVLRDISRFINEEYSRFVNSSLKDKRAQPQDISSGAFQDVSAEAPPQNKNVKIFLLKKMGDAIAQGDIFSAASNEVIAIPKELEKVRKVYEGVSARLPRVFRLDEKMPEHEAFRIELDNTRMKLIQAIKNSSLAQVNTLKKRYVLIAEEFLRNLHDSNSAYSPEDAAKEGGGFFSEGWHEVRWLQDDLREIMTEASASDHKDIILDIAYVPIAIAARAIKVRDHLLFRRFLDFSTYLYYLASGKPSGSVREIMTHRAWKYPEELVKYHLRFLVDDGGHPANSSKDLEDFGLYTLTTYMKLIKTAFDKKDEVAFKQFLSAFDGVKDSLVPEKTGLTVATLEKLLEGATKEEVRARLTSQLEKQRVVEHLENAVHSAYNEIIFGISGWILDQFFKNSDATAKALFFEVSSRLPKNMSGLAKVLEDVVEKDTARKWGWDWWDIVPDGKARWVDTDTMPSRLFCFQALRLMDQIPQDRRQDFIIAPSRYLARAAEQDNSAIKNIVADIKENRSPWREILSEAETSHADLLLAAIEKIKAAQKEEEQKRLRSEKISPERITFFRDEIKKYLSEYARMKKMMQKLGLFQSSYDQSPPEGIRSWGFNQLDEKAVFLDNWYSEHVGWGQSYGEGLARSEDRISFKRMIDAIPDKKEIIAQDSISEIEKAISEANLKDPIVIQSLSHSIEYEELRGHEKFIAHYDEKCPQTKISGLEGFIGVLTFKKGSSTVDVPVFDIFVGSDALLKNKILVTDIQRFACWHQFAPVEKEADRLYVDGDLLVHVSDLNQDDTLRTEILNQNPDWLQSKDNKEDYLRGRVVIKVFERFDIEIKAPEAAVCLSVTDAEDPVS